MSLLNKTADRPVSIEMTLAHQEWASVCAALMFMQVQMKSVEETKGPMPAHIAARYETLGKVIEEIKVRLAADELEAELNI